GTLRGAGPVRGAAAAGTDGGSLRLDAGRRNHLAPFLIVVADDLRELLRRGADHVDADRGHALVKAGVGDDRRDLAVERGDDVGRRAGRCHESHSRTDLEAGKRRLRDRRNVRQRGDALAACGGEDAQLALVDQRQQRVDGAGGHVEPAGPPPRAATRSGSTAGAPRNGTCTRSTPAFSLNSSPPRCCGVPTPTEPKLSLLGDDLASAMNSCRLRAGRLAGTTMTNGTSATWLIG